MTNIRKYKTLLAAVLLTVYAFIATPIRLWHYHNYIVNTKSEKSSEQKVAPTFFNSSHHAIDANCKICSHQYSVYSDATIIVFDSPSLTLQSNKEYYFFLIPSYPHFNFFNKGPPAIA